MAVTVGDVNVKFGTDLSEFNTGLKTVQSRLNQLSGKLRSIGTKMSLAVSLPLGLIAKNALETAGNFQTAMNRVRALTDATGESFEALEAQARDLGRTTQFTAQESADAMGFLAQAGFEANEIIGAMPGTLQLAASAQLDLASSADLVTNVLTGYNLSVDELSRVNDVLVKSFTSANTDLSQLGQAMKFAGPVASAMGIEFEEAAAALSLMGNAGIQSTMAGTSLRGALNPSFESGKECSRNHGETGHQCKKRKWFSGNPG